jgi:hypothetical protein
MKKATMPLLAAAGILLTPLAALAEGPTTSMAVQNCAHALADQLHVPLGPVHYQQNMHPILSTSGLVNNELVQCVQLSGPPEPANALHL